MSPRSMNPWRRRRSRSWFNKFAALVAVALLSIAALATTASRVVGADDPGDGDDAPSTSSITIVEDAHDAQNFPFTVSGDGLTGFSLDDDDDSTLANTQTFSNLTSGSYTITQDEVAGWKLADLSCSSPTTVDLAARAVTIDFHAQTDVTCTFTNQLPDTITIMEGAHAPQDFAFAVSGDGLSGFRLDDDDDPTLPNTQAFSRLAAGSYTISQEAVAGWKLESLTCSSPATIDLGSRTATIDFVSGVDVTCTFTNEVPATLTIVEDAHDGQDFSYSVSSGQLDGFSLDDDSDPVLPNTRTFPDLASGVYTVSQGAVPEWKLVSLTCTSPATVDVTARTVSIEFVAADGVTCTFTNAPDRPLAGAIRWDAWMDGPIGRQHEYALGPEEYRYRLPSYAKVVGPDQVEVRADSQDVADEQIDAAADLGVDYFAFVWYGDGDGTRFPLGSENETLSRGLRLYRSSADRDRVKYSVIMTPEYLADPDQRALVVSYMRDPNWVKVDGRPMLFVGLQPAQSKLDFDDLRAASIAQGIGDPYIVYLINPNAFDAGVATSASFGLDALSYYAIGDGSPTGGPYADVAAKAQQYWNRAAATGSSVVPTAMAGWDPRPRIERIPNQTSGKKWSYPATDLELGYHLRAAVDWAFSHASKAMLIYAWNEYDEGGWLGPTLVEDDARLSAVHDALTARPGDPPPEPPPPPPSPSTTTSTTSPPSSGDDEDPVPPDSPTPKLDIADARVAEGNAATTPMQFAVELSRAATSPVTVGYTTANVSAVAPTDFVATSGTLTFAPGQMSKVVVVAAKGDTQVEGDETFSVLLRNPQGATLTTDQATGTIVNDDREITLTVGDASQPEGPAGATTKLVFPVELSDPSTLAVKVSFATESGTALSGSDFSATSGRLVIAPGATKASITVGVKGDAVIEDDERFTLRLSSPLNARLASDQAIGTIGNDDRAVTLRIGDVSATEGASGTKKFVFPVVLSEPSANQVKVAFTTVSGTAVVGPDFARAADRLTINAGAPGGSITVYVKGEKVREADETFSVVLSAPVNASITRERGIGTIVNDD